MTRTFLIALDLDEDADLVEISEDLFFLLQDDYTVKSVRPWASPLSNLDPLSRELYPSSEPPLSGSDQFA